MPRVWDQEWRGMDHPGGKASASQSCHTAPSAAEIWQAERQDG